ncbi:MAG: hypothetical protein J0H82_31045 [Alphaproteobacteria bacterium]|jgi:hypothetical protein|nr:hypothetical protein [Alphaproteobacteria bacterium]
MSGDADMLLRQRHILEEIEHGIRLANREVLNQVLPRMGRDHVLALAVAVAKLRGAYLAAAMRLVRPAAADLAEIRAKREAYDEARQAFEALERAIERGYVELQD